MTLTFIAMLLNVMPCNFHTIIYIELDVNSNEYNMALIIVFVIVNVFFTLTWRSNPGYLTSSEKISFLKLVEKFDPNMLCPTCEVICTSESRHCYICNKCVERFDHHCQWINNCVGVRNHSWFYMYIFSLEAYLLMVVVYGIICKSNKH